MRKKTCGALLGILLVLSFWKEAWAGITSLWADDATLIKQLTELIEIHNELERVSDGIRHVADATGDIVDTYSYAKDMVAEVQAYGPVALWRDFRDDLYEHYPGFEHLEGLGSLSKWKRSRSTRPPKTYELIGAVFGDLTKDLKKKEREGNLDTTALRLSRFESAGALSLSAEAEEKSKEFDQDIAHLYRQVEDATTAEEASLIMAKASLIQAAQNSSTIRLLSRGVRLEGVRSAIEYGRRVRTLNSGEKVGRDAESAVKALSKSPKLLKFEF